MKVAKIFFSINAGLLGVIFFGVAGSFIPEQRR